MHGVDVKLGLGIVEAGNYMMTGVIMFFSGFVPLTWGVGPTVGAPLF